METIKLNFTTYDIKAVTGRVVSADRDVQTQIYSSGGYNNMPVSVSSHNTVSNDIYLEDSQGKEHLFRLVNFDVACRNGHVLTVIETPKQGKKNGRYLLVINHNTGHLNYHTYSVKHLCAPNKYLLGGAYLVLAFLLLLAGAGVPAVLVFLFVTIGLYPLAEKYNEKKLKNFIDSLKFQ